MNHLTDYDNEYFVDIENEVIIKAHNYNTVILTKDDLVRMLLKIEEQETC